MRYLLFLLVGFLPSIAKAQTADMCSLLARNPAWTQDLKSAQEQWQIKPGTVLAIIDQESRFNAHQSNP
jgi:soluble lytic murein transglycosylase-like protein